jgi:multiple sugar transport system permease protein
MGNPHQTRLLAAFRWLTVLMAMGFALFPVFWLVSTSFKSYEEWASSPPHWLPQNPTLQNYRIVFAPEAARQFAAHQSDSLDYKVSGSAWSAFGSSALVATAATFLSVTFGTLAAYGISRFRGGGRGFAFRLLTVRMFPPIAVVVPMVVLFSLLRLTDTHLGLILAYTTFTLPFSVWMIRSFIEEVPIDLELAGRVHGYGRWQVFTLISLPLIRGGILATGLFVFILNWSEFLFALVLTSGHVVTVTLQVANYVSASSGKLYGVQAAMGTISTIPVILFGFLIQGHLARGLTLGAVHG